MSSLAPVLGSIVQVVSPRSDHFGKYGYVCKVFGSNGFGVRLLTNGKICYSKKGVRVIDPDTENNTSESDAELIQQVREERDYYFEEDPHGRYESNRSRGNTAFSGSHHIPDEEGTRATEGEEEDEAREKIERLLRATTELHQQLGALTIETRAGMNNLNRRLATIENNGTQNGTNMVEDSENS